MQAQAKSPTTFCGAGCSTQNREARFYLESMSVLSGAKLSHLLHDLPTVVENQSCAEQIDSKTNYAEP